MAWAADAKSFYHVDADATVRRVTYPEFKEVAALKPGRGVWWLGLSAEGVVLTLIGTPEIWLLDPTTLAVKSRITAGQTYRVAVTPKSSFAYSTQWDNSGARLLVIDLKRGQKVKQYTFGDLRTKEFTKELTLPWYNPVLSADGKYLFTTGNAKGRVARFAVDGPKVRLEEISSPLIGGTFVSLCISPAGDFICAPSGGGHCVVEGTNRSEYGTYVFRLDNLNRPVATLLTGPYPSAVGFDTEAKRVYAQGNGSQLIVLDHKGVKQKEYKLAAAGGVIRQFLVHPTGRQVLLLCYGAGNGNSTKPAAIVAVKLP
jgi:hypothetical protein